MHHFLNQYLFKDKNSNYKAQGYFAMFFIVFTIVALGLDSVFFTQNYFDVRQITNFLALVYFSLLFCTSNSHLRKLMFVMVFLSYIGELIFCKLLGLSEYRTDSIPLYVPFGHAIVYASGFIFAHTSWAIKYESKLRTFFSCFFLLLFLAVGIFLHDIFSLIFGLCFFILLKRKRWQNLYYSIALCVIFIELVGTYFKCWTWVPKTFGVIPTINPPMGAVFFYAGGDVLLAKIVAFWDHKNLKNKIIIS